MTPNRTAQEIHKSPDNHCQKDLIDTECPPDSTPWSHGLSPPY